MSTIDDSDQIDAAVRIVRIIIFAMVLGLVAMIAISAFPGPFSPKAGANPPEPPVAGNGNLPIFTIAAVLMAAANVPLSMILPGVVTTSLGKKLATGQSPAGATPGDLPGLLAIFLNRTIVGAALTEGPGFLSAIAYMLESNPIALGLAAILTILVALRFPSRDRVNLWLEDQFNLLKLERQGTIDS